MPESWLDRRASNAKLIAKARDRIAKGNSAVLYGEQLVRQSARLVPSSVFDPPPAGRGKRLDEALAKQVRYEQVRIKEIREIGYFLRSCMKETVVASPGDPLAGAPDADAFPCTAGAFAAAAVCY